MSETRSSWIVTAAERRVEVKISTIFSSTVSPYLNKQSRPRITNPSTRGTDATLQEDRMLRGTWKEPGAHYSDVIMSAMATQSPASRLFPQSFVQAHIKENIKAPRYCLCEGNPPVTGGFPSQRASNAENASIWWRHHGKSYLMTTEWTTIHVVYAGNIDSLTPLSQN